MNNIKTPSLNGDKIVEQYPLSMIAYKEWLGAFPNAEEAGLGKDGLIYENSLKAVFYFSPRSLYDFFDYLGLELTIRRNEVKKWWFNINSGYTSEIMYDSRIATEEAGFQTCFELQERAMKGQKQ